MTIKYDEVFYEYEGFLRHKRTMMEKVSNLLDGLNEELTCGAEELTNEERKELEEMRERLEAIYEGLEGIASW